VHAVRVPASELPPVCADFPDPEPLPGREAPNPAGGGMHNAVRGISSGRHHRSTNPYPMVPGIGAVARTSHGRRVRIGYTQAPEGTVAERMATPFALEPAQSRQPRVGTPGTRTQARVDVVPD
jgi:hypothetical protein